MEQNLMTLNSLDLNNVTGQLKNWSNGFGNSMSSQNVTIGDLPNGSGSTSGGQVGASTITNVTYPHYNSYPYTWITYNTSDISNKDKVLVTKAENGFVLVYNGKTFIARTENEVAKVIVKCTKEGKENGKI